MAEVLSRLYADFPTQEDLAEARTTIEQSHHILEVTEQEAKAKMEAAEQEVISIQEKGKAQLQSLNEKIESYNAKLQAISLIVDPLIEND